jgi:hypothetical protein
MLQALTDRVGVVNRSAGEVKDNQLDGLHI